MSQDNSLTNENTTFVLAKDNTAREEQVNSQDAQKIQSTNLNKVQIAEHTEAELPVDVAPVKESNERQKPEKAYELNSNSSMNNFLSPREVTIEEQDPIDGSPPTQFKINSAKAMMVAQTLATICSIAANVAFFMGTLDTLSKVECIEQIEKAPRSNEVLLIATGFELICFILQITCLIRINTKQEEKASCITFLYLTVLSNITLEAASLSLALYINDILLVGEATSGTRFLAVMITAALSMVVGIVEVIITCSLIVQHNKQNIKVSRLACGLMFLTIFMTFLGALAVGSLFAMTMSTESICPPCIPDLQASPTNHFTNQTITWFNSQPASYTISAEANATYSQSSCSYAYTIDAKQVLDDAMLEDLPIELDFNAETEVFSISKCLAGVIETTEGEDIECMQIPFDKTINVALVYQLQADPLIECQSGYFTAGFMCNPPFETVNREKQFSITIRDPCRNDTIAIEEKTSDIYYIRPDEAKEQVINTTISQYLSYCPVSCTLHEDDKVYTHPAIQSFVPENGQITLNTSNIAYFETTMGLEVTCVSLSSEQELATASDVIIIKFEDPCQFDKVAFENPSAIEDYYIYYVEDTSAEVVLIDVGFTQELTYCPSICSLFEPDEAVADHPAVQMFNETTGLIEISTADTTLFDTQLSLQVVCESTSSEQDGNNTASNLFTINFQDPCQFDSISFENEAAIDDYYIYYVHSDSAIDVTVDYGFTHNMTQCPSSCALLEEEEPFTHSSIISFDNQTGKVLISTSDTSLFESVLTLHVTCETSRSRQDNRTVSDIFTVKFEDPCQFDKVSLENPSAIEDYYIYYVDGRSAEDVVIDFGFTQELTYCPSNCSLYEPDEADADHPAVLMFNQITGLIKISTADTSLFDTRLSLQIVCESTSSEQDENNTVSNLFTINFQDPCQFDTVSFANQAEIENYYVYYVYEDDAVTVALDYGFTQIMNQCGAACSLLEADSLAYSHPSIQLFDNTTAQVQISTIDTSLFDTTLTLHVVCESIASTQTNRTVTDVLTINFEDPCMFDKGYFERRYSIEPYYIQANTAIIATIDHNFSHDLDFCPFTCILEGVNSTSTHPAISEFNKTSSQIKLDSSDTSLIGTLLTLQVTCTSTRSIEDNKEVTDVFVVDFEDYCQFARIQSLTITEMSPIQVSLFETVSIHWELQSDNENCPVLNTATEMTSNFLVNPRFTLTDNVMQGVIEFQPTVLDRPVATVVAGSVSSCLREIDGSSTDCLQTVEADEFVFELIDPCATSQITAELISMIDTPQFSRNTLPIDGTFNNTVSDWAALNAYGEDVCGPIQYQLDYTTEEVFPLADLVVLTQGPSIPVWSLDIEPRSTVPVGDYLLKLTGLMTDFSEVEEAVTTFTVSVNSIYDQIATLDIPARQGYPQADELEGLPLGNFKLSQIRFKQVSEGERMYAIQLAFANGVQTPLFGTADGGELHELQVVNILDTSRDIKYVSMRVSWSYSGMRFFDQNQEQIAQVIWYDEGEWTQLQEIPDGQQIVGLKCDYESVDYVIQHLSFVLGKQGQSEITGEIRFPQFSLYPSYEQFNELYMSGGFQLSAINYKLDQYEDGLSGIQLVFSNGMRSTVLEAQDSADIDFETIEIDTTKTIRFISVRTFYGKWFRGIRLYDQEENLILNEDWRDDQLVNDEQWTPLQEIQEGKQIIGVQADNSNSNSNLIALSFMLGPIPDE